MQYSAYIEHSCQVLTEAAEQESDIIIVAMVKIQAFVDLTYRSLHAKGFTDWPKAAPAWMHVKSAQAQLQTYWESLTLEVQKNRKFFPGLKFSLRWLIKSFIKSHGHYESSRFRSLTLCCQHSKAGLLVGKVDSRVRLLQPP